MMDFLANLGGLGSAVLMTVKAAGPALLVGAVIKHGDKVPGLRAVTKRIPNGLIPAILPIVGTAVSGDPIVGTLGAAGATWSQQLLKVGLRTLTEKVLGTGVKAARLQSAVGPGGRLSI